MGIEGKQASKLVQVCVYVKAEMIGEVFFEEGIKKHE